MAKKKVSSKTESKQTIKRFDSGVVSWSLFSDFHDIILAFEGYLHFLCKSAFDFGELDDFSVAMDLIENQLEQFEKAHKEFWGKAGIENDQAGGNDVATIRDISLTRLKAEELVTNISRCRKKAEQELEEIAA